MNYAKVFGLLFISLLFVSSSTPIARADTTNGALIELSKNMVLIKEGVVATNAGMSLIVTGTLTEDARTRLVVDTGTASLQEDITLPTEDILIPKGTYNATQVQIPVDALPAFLKDTTLERPESLSLIVEGTNAARVGDASSDGVVTYRTLVGLVDEHDTGVYTLPTADTNSADALAAFSTIVNATLTLPQTTPVSAQTSQTTMLSPQAPSLLNTRIEGFVVTGGTNSMSDVMVLQTFLNVFENAGLTVNGIFDTPSQAAVVAYQTKYQDAILVPLGLTQATGDVYASTRMHIQNRIDNLSSSVTVATTSVTPAQTSVVQAPKQHTKEKFDTEKFPVMRSATKTKDAPSISVNTVFSEKKERAEKPLPQQTETKTPNTTYLGIIAASLISLFLFARN